MPDVSVIIPSYNHARFVSQAVASALNQTLKPLEVIVVDDGSKDETADALAQFGESIRVIRQENSGVATARNNGAAAANGALLAFLDADDVWVPNKLEKQVERFNKEPGLGLVHCAYVDIDADNKELTEHFEGLEGWVAEEIILFRRPVILGGGSGVVIPKKVFSELGGFDARLSTSADFDLYFRIARKWRVGFVPEVLLQYRIHGSNMHGNINLMKRDMLLAYDKAFADTDESFMRLRRRAYASLYMNLAGSFLTVGQKRACLTNMIKGVWLWPGNIKQVVGYPLRMLQRR
jgi:glycosyltransferase involved in cell wall biosynthesis